MGTAACSFTHHANLMGGKLERLTSFMKDKMAFGEKEVGKVTQYQEGNERQRMGGFENIARSYRSFYCVYNYESLKQKLWNIQTLS